MGLRGDRLVCSCLLWWRELSDRDDGRLFFVDLSQQDRPGRRFVAAASGGFVEAEGLEGSGKRKEEQGWGDEDANVEMGQSGVLQKSVRRGHGYSFLHKEMKYDKFSLILRNCRDRCA